MLVGDFLIEMRINSGKTQSQIASYIGCSRRTYYNYEMDLGEISLKKFIKTVHFCGYEPNTIIENILNSYKGNNYRALSLMK